MSRKYLEWRTRFINENSTVCTRNTDRSPVNKIRVLYLLSWKHLTIKDNIFPPRKSTCKMKVWKFVRCSHGREPIEVLLVFLQFIFAPWNCVLKKFYRHIHIRYSDIHHFSFLLIQMFLSPIYSSSSFSLYLPLFSFLVDNAFSLGQVKHQEILSFSNRCDTKIPLFRLNAWLENAPLRWVLSTLMKCVWKQPCFNLGMFCKFAAANLDEKWMSRIDFPSIQLCVSFISFFSWTYCWRETDRWIRKQQWPSRTNARSSAHFLIYLFTVGNDESPSLLVTSCLISRV